ncbi:MAG: tetratricopeptide repeat protein [Proteobacteria bacterium]|nr:tetratricopeptide repeat protein [Pseudomonadota bacterium]
MRRNPIVSTVIYVCLFLSILMLADYLFIKKNIFKNLNPVAQMQSYYREKNYTKVIEKGAPLLNNHPNSLIMRRYLWKSYIYTKQYNKALRIVSEMESIAPKSIEVPLAYCTVFRTMGEYEKMKYYCDKVLEIKPDNEQAHEQFVQALIDKKNYLEAENYLKKLEAKQSDNFKRSMLMANVEMLENDYKKAIDVLERARKIYTEEPIIYYYLGESYYQTGEYAKAAGFLEEFTDTVYKQDVDVELLQNAYTTLASSYEKAMMFSNAYRAYKNAACLTIKLDKTDETIRLMTRAITNTYAGYTGFVSQNDFKKKFKKLENELEKQCDSQLFETKEE